MEERTIAEMFEEQVERDGGAVAVVCGKERVSYQELNERAERVAWMLEREGVGVEDVVGVGVPRSVEMIVSMLGILKAGGAYLPLYLEYPAERLEWMVKDAGPKCVLTRGGREEKLPGWVKQIAVGQDNKNGEELWSEAGRGVAPGRAMRGVGRKKVRVQGSNAAYVMYTSGSTGVPKGVVIPQRAVVRLVKGADYVELDQNTVMLQYAPVSFDASTFEIWGSLLNGGKLAVFREGVGEVEELGRFVREEGINVMWLPAGLFHAVVSGGLEDYAGVKQLVAGGDVLAIGDVKRVVEGLPGCRLINGYGPTEGTTFSCCGGLGRGEVEKEEVPIGRPIRQTQVYVLDEGLEMAGVGVKGELYLGGAGLGRGYSKQGGMTAERFVANPYGGRGDRMYRTGDVVRWRREGKLEFIGRVDQQVKVRGYRVELGEIEAMLEALEGVDQGVVVVRGNDAGEKRLVGYVTGKGEARLEGGELRGLLGQRLPEYMVPGVIMVLEEMPLTANGKVDRRRLPEPEYKGKEWRAPQTPQEEIVCKLMAEVLKVDRVGLDDNFFELGGHSLLATQLISRIYQAFDVKLAIYQIFAATTIAELVGVIETLILNELQQMSDAEAAALSSPLDSGECS